MRRRKDGARAWAQVALARRAIAFAARVVPLPYGARACRRSVPPGSGSARGRAGQPSRTATVRADCCCASSTPPRDAYRGAQRSAQCTMHNAASDTPLPLCDVRTRRECTPSRCVARCSLVHREVRAMHPSASARRSTPATLHGLFSAPTAVRRLPRVPLRAIQSAEAGRVHQRGRGSSEPGARPRCASSRNSPCSGHLRGCARNAAEWHSRRLAPRAIGNCM